MKTGSLVLAAALLVGGGLTCLAQTKVWTGAGDGIFWTNGANWSGGTVPGAADDVVMSSGAGTTVAFSFGHVTIRSLHCTNKTLTLSGGLLGLTAGASHITGPFSISDGAGLEVAGVGSTLTVSGPTTAADGEFSATGGGVMHLPNLRAVTNNNTSVTWTADGSGSLLDVSSVTNLLLGSVRILYLNAYHGGMIDLHRLTNSIGAVRIDAQDPGTVVDLSGLTGRWKSTANYSLTLEAQTGASILIPNVTQMEKASLRIDNTGMIPTAQLNLLTNVTLTVDAAAPNFGLLTNIDDCDVYALNAGVARLTNVFRATQGNRSSTWEADAAGSLIDLSGLTELTVASTRILYLNAYHSGVIELHRLSGSTGAVRIDARDPGTVVDLSGLTGRWKSVGSYSLTLEAQTGASILIPNVTQMEYASLSINNTGVIPTAQLNLLSNVTLTVDAAAPNFGRLTNIDGCDVYVRNAGAARLTNVFRATHGNQSPTWEANGAGSLLDLSSLTTLTMGSSRVLYLNAYSGGVLDLRRLSSSTGSVRIDAQDPGSVVDLSGLTGRWRSVGSYSLTLEARTGASILIPNVTQMEFAALTLDGTGVIPTAQLNLLSNVTLTVNGAAPNFSSLTNIDDCDVYAIYAGVARLTNVFRATHGNQSPTWQADGAGSLVDLSSLTNVTVSTTRILYLSGYNGGHVDLHRLSGSTGAVRVYAEDPGTVVDLSGLTGRWKSVGNYSLAVEAQTGASILIPNVTQLEFASLTIDDTGLISTAQLNLLTNVTLTVNASAPDFHSLTNIDDCDVYAQNGGVAALTNVLYVTARNQSPTWRTDDPGSAINLSRLRGVSVGNVRILYVQCYTGGTIDLSSLLSLSTGAVRVLSDGTGSVIDLSALSSFISVGSYSSSLTAQNGGVILLGTQAFLLANVGINIPPGNPVLPPTLLPSATLTLYGTPWHAYWVEKRDTSSNTNDWVFAARVPLTNSFQAVAPVAPANCEFRVWDFVTDPPIVDIFPSSGSQVTMVIYHTPSLTNQLVTATSILTPMGSWQPGQVTVMTNAFRILPPVAAADPVRFYRAKRL